MPRRTCCRPAMPISCCCLQEQHTQTHSASKQAHRHAHSVNGLLLFFRCADPRPCCHIPLHSLSGAIQQCSADSTPAAALSLRRPTSTALQPSSTPLSKTPPPPPGAAAAAALNPRKHKPRPPRLDAMSPCVMRRNKTGSHETFPPPKNLTTSPTNPPVQRPLVK